MRDGSGDNNPVSGVTMMIWKIGGKNGYLLVNRQACYAAIRKPDIL
jgi:hypothetical protein